MEYAQSSTKIYLSLGSNIGNRQEYLQNAINLLFERIGAVLKISPVYETPALGFEGEAFLNLVVIMTTEFAPAELMTELLSIEKQLGRERNSGVGYQSRTVDIDILFYGDEIIKSEDLMIPHREIQNRKFVLQPLNDIEPTKQHPGLEQSIASLLVATFDDSLLKKTAISFQNPMNAFDFSKYNYIAIEGNIGAGKTSLTTKISSDFNAKLILERFRDNPFLPKFYADPSRYAFPLEMSFLADRYQQLVDDIAQLDLFQGWILADYDVNKSLIFAGITLPEDEYSLYKKLFHVMHKDLPKPDLYVYLYQSTERLLENIKKRGREYEQSIPADYLQKLNIGYLDYIKSRPSENVRIIDITEIDFVRNRADYLKILRLIAK